LPPYLHGEGDKALRSCRVGVAVGEKADELVGNFEGGHDGTDRVSRHFDASVPNIGLRGRLHA
jgi:hypothetical protein